MVTAVETPADRGRRGGARARPPRRCRGRRGALVAGPRTAPTSSARVGYAPSGTVRFSWTDWAAVRSELESDVDADSSRRRGGGVPQRRVRRRPHLRLGDGRVGVRCSRSGTASRPPTSTGSCSARATTGSVLDPRAAGRPRRRRARRHLRGARLRAAGRRRRESGSGGEELLAGSAPAGRLPAVPVPGPRRGPRTWCWPATARRTCASAVDGSTSDDGSTTRAPRRRGRDRRAALGRRLRPATYACRSLAMAQADEDDQSAADQLVAAAGEVDPLTGFAMAAEPDGDVLVAMSFENDDQARRNADSRAAAGGRSGARAGRRLRRPVRPRRGHRRRPRGHDASSTRSRAARCSRTCRPARCCSRPARAGSHRADGVPERQPEPVPPVPGGSDSPLKSRGRRASHRTRWN